MPFLRTIFSLLIRALFPPPNSPSPALAPATFLSHVSTVQLVGVFIQYKVCQSNTNGNQGRLVAVCVGSSCRFFQWHPSSSRSPSLHTTPPALPSQGVSHSIAPAVSFSAISSTKRVCPAPVCGKTHLADDCDRKLYRKHCLKLGSCSLKKHKPSSAQDSFNSQPVATPLTSTPPSLDHLIALALASTPLKPAPSLNPVSMPMMRPHIPSTSA
ncbi:hypothetical protein BDN70DRAFT_937410 [Pholiota conissans]|uniref:Uncharacterized protein n=1 Tax=Pholiota conissans TaxID=109636 RepID=A0A9P5YQX7_9AGAR|nr:hypothetical protein BDN70DRAFT_937410 [Pholiota conissans]